jgi:hypothetical protein
MIINFILIYITKNYLFFMFNIFYCFKDFLINHKIHTKIIQEYLMCPNKQPLQPKQAEFHL